MPKDAPDSSEKLASAFKAVTSRQELATLLGASLRNMLYYVRAHPEPYRSFEVKKRNGSQRTISAPVEGLKIIQRKLSDFLYAIYRTRVCVHGFAKDRSILSNAEKHVDKRYVLNFDLEDFFGSIHVGRVIGLFEKTFHFNKPVATLLGQICCRMGKLPQGAPTSPVISNLLCWTLDNKLLHIAKTHRCEYSRYADDITFSTQQRRFPLDVANIDETDGVTAIKIGSIIRDTVIACGFRINDSKTRLLTKTQRQEVTGVVVNARKNVDRRFIRNIRAALYRWSKEGTEISQANYESKHRKTTSQPSLPSSFENVMKGRIQHVAYVRGVKDNIYINLVRRFNEMASSPMTVPSPPISDLTDRLRKSVWVVEHDVTSSGNKYMTGRECGQGTAFHLRDVG